MPFNRTSLRAVMAFAAFISVSGCGQAGVNGSVHVLAGDTVENATTVNGSVNIGDGARVGRATTVNGGIRLGQNVTATSVKTVNGGVRVGSGAKVTKDVVAVNGSIDLARGADVVGRVTNVNGNIRLDSAHVGGGITTFNGDIRVGRGSRVEGGIHVQKPEYSNHWTHQVPRIEIGPGVVVDGPLKFDREVKLYVSGSARIGPVEGATVEHYPGEHPDGDEGHYDEFESPPTARGGPERE